MEYRNQIVTGDARVLAERIPDESVDLILCDPVYTEIEHYAWLARLAGRALRDGGNVVAQTGHIYRFEAECAMLDDRLEKRPLITEVFTGGYRTIWKHKCLKADHPYIWLEKGRPNGRDWMRTLFFGSRDKTHHEWGDGWRGFAFLTDRLSSPGATVLDPFTGGGTVPAVCRAFGRNYVAFEIDPATADRARERVRNTQPPLFVPEPEQLEMAL